MKRSALILGLETSGNCVGVALVKDGVTVSSVERFTSQPRADDLRQFIEQVCAAARVTFDDVTGLAISEGPGSFTGLRIGASFVKGLALGSSLPVVGVPTMDVIARNAWGARGTVVVLLDARQEQVYAAAYQGDGAGLRRVLAPRRSAIEALRPWLKRGTLFLGDGAALYAAALRRLIGRCAVVAPPELWWPHAATVAQLGAQRLARGRRKTAATLTPRYLYPDDCTIRKTVKISKSQ